MRGSPYDAGTAVPTPDLVAAWHTLDVLPSERVPLWAAHWLADGHDGHALRTLAGLDGRDPRAARDLLSEVLPEVGASLPSPETAANTAYTDLARRYLDGLVSERWVVAKAEELAITSEYAEEICGPPLGSLHTLDDEWNAGWGRNPSELAAIVHTTCLEQLESNDSP